jgi:hypothetical protein
VSGLKARQGDRQATLNRAREQAEARERVIGDLKVRSTNGQIMVK